jgi:hypothetical protein
VRLNDAGESKTAMVRFDDTVVVLKKSAPVRAVDFAPPVEPLPKGDARLSLWGQDAPRRPAFLHGMSGFGTSLKSLVHRHRFFDALGFEYQGPIDGTTEP